MARVGGTGWDRVALPEAMRWHLAVRSHQPVLFLLRMRMATTFRYSQVSFSIELSPNPGSIPLRFSVGRRQSALCLMAVEALRMCGVTAERECHSEWIFTRLDSKYFSATNMVVVMCSLTYSLKLFDFRKNWTTGRFPVFRQSHESKLISGGLVIVEHCKICDSWYHTIIIPSYSAVYQGTRVLQGFCR